MTWVGFDFFDRTVSSCYIISYYNQAEKKNQNSSVNLSIWIQKKHVSIVFVFTWPLLYPWCILLSWVFSRGHVSSFPLILMSLGTVLYIGERLHQTSFKTMCLCYRPKSTSDIKQTQIFALSCWVISICPNHKLRLRLSSPELRTLRLLSYLAQGCSVCAGPADRTHDTGPHASSTRHKGGF